MSKSCICVSLYWEMMSFLWGKVTRFPESRVGDRSSAKRYPFVGYDPL